MYVVIKNINNELYSIIKTFMEKYFTETKFEVFKDEIFSISEIINSRVTELPGYE